MLNLFIPDKTSMSGFIISSRGASSISVISKNYQAKGQEDRIKSDILKFYLTDNWVTIESTFLGESYFF